MTFRETTVNFSDEIERLEEERKELAEDVAELPDGSTAQQRKIRRGQAIDVYLEGLEWAKTAHEDDDCPAWDVDVDEITLSGLSTGQYGALKGALSEHSSDNVPKEQVEIVAKVRLGTIDAPYLDASATEEQQTAAVASLHPKFSRWADAKIEDLMTVGNGDRKSFVDLLAQTQTSD